MFRNIIIGQYIPRDSKIHQLDPRTKLLSVFFLLIATFVISNPLGYLLLTVFSLCLVGTAQIPTKIFLQSLKPIFWFIVFTMGFHFFLTEGKELVHLGPLVMTEEGVKRGIAMGWRLLLLIVFSSLLTLTTSPLSLTDGLETLFNPWKRFGVPVHEMAMMITIALRFIPTLLEEAEKILKAQTARGMDFSQGSLWRRVKALLPLLVPLFIGAFRRADDLAVAMEARCYRGGVGRTRMKDLQMTGIDLWGLVFVLLVLLAIIEINRLGVWSI